MTTTPPAIAGAIEALELAREFISNGLEFGYIPRRIHGTEITLPPEIDAALAALRAHRAAPEGWTSIEERHPPPHTDVHFLCADGSVYPGRACYGLHAPWWVGSGPVEGMILSDHGAVVTHWRLRRLLPAPDPAPELREALTNERGNNVDVAVRIVPDSGDVEIAVTGPHSMTTDLLTRAEAEALLRVLSAALSRLPEECQ